MIFQRVIKVFIITILFSLVLIYTPQAVRAQLTDEEIDAGLETCFEYYNYGEVEVSLATDKSSYKPGETAEIFGTVVNNNTFPLSDIVIYAQLRRENSGGDFDTEGHYLIESRKITEPMNLLPGESRAISATWDAKSTYPNGEYLFQYYVFSEKGFHYSGRPFLEEDIAGTSLFDIEGSAAPLVYFDLSSVRVNQVSHSIRETIQEYPDNSLNIAASIIDSRTVKTDIPVTIEFYAFEDTFESNLISTQQKVIPGGVTTITADFTPPAAGAYVAVMKINSPTESQLKYRFAKTGGSSPTLKVNDMGITNYPPGNDDRAFLCVYSPAPVESATTSISLKVLDKDKKTVDEKSITRQFSGNIVAISVPLAGLSGSGEFYVQGTLTPQGGAAQNIENHYACSMFNVSPTDLQVNFDSWSSKLNISAVNACSESIETGGHLESVQIKNQAGEIVDEYYNTDSISQNIDLANLPAGDYTVEVKSGGFSKSLPIKVAGISTNVVARNWIVILAILVPVLLLVVGGVIYMRRKHRAVEESSSPTSQQPKGENKI